MMSVNILKKSILRHLNETSSFIEKLDDKIIFQEPISGSRPLGEIVLHMIRSIHFYLKGCIKDIWEPQSYLQVVVEDFNRPATKEEILQEMIEHSIHHRGQLSVYFRLLKMNPPVIEYII